MPVTYPKPIVVPPPEGGATTAVCIFLHGLGDTGHGWADVASSMPFEGVKWVFPTAPTIPVTLNGGMRMTGWYDINDLSIDNIKDDRDQTLASTEYIQGLIKEQVDSGVDASRIVVGGFSQGGVIALQTALRSKERLAGAVGMSTYLALRDDFPDAMSPNAKDLPVFLAHGTADQVLQYQYGVASHEHMIGKLGMTAVSFQTYQGMGHSACQEELQQLARSEEQVQVRGNYVNVNYIDNINNENAYPLPAYSERGAHGPDRAEPPEAADRKAVVAVVPPKPSNFSPGG